MKRIKIEIGMMLALVAFLSTSLSSVALAADLLAYEPFHTSANYDSVSYYADVDIGPQSPPPALGFSQTDKWGDGGGVDKLYPARASCDFINGGILKTSAGSAWLNSTGGGQITYAKSRALTNGLVAANLPVIYFSAVFRFQPNSSLVDYWCMGLGSAAVTSGNPGHACMVGLVNNPDNDDDPTTAEWLLMRKGDKLRFGSNFTINTSKDHLLVMKVELNANGNSERISVFVDPDPSKSEVQNASAKLLDQHEADVFNNSSNITHIGFWSWNMENLYPRMDELRLGTTWDAVTPTEANTLYAHEPFNGYTDGVRLDGSGKGQTSIGFDPPTDWVSTSWGSKIVADADGLTYAKTLDLTSRGGSAANIGNVTGTVGLVTYNDLRALSTPVDADMTKIYVSGIARYTQLLGDYAGFGISREPTWDVGKRALSLGVAKNGTLLQHSYGTDNKAGENNYGDTFAPGTDTYFYVARVDMNVGAASAERITIYLNPDPALNEMENKDRAAVSYADAELFTNSSAISHIHLWSWYNPNGSSFDEIRVGSSWASVTPCDPLTPLGTMFIIH